MPRIEGIDDEPEVKPVKSESAKLSDGLFGMGKGKHDFNDQADDILAETFDADIASAQQSKKRQQQAQAAADQEQSEMFDEAFENLPKELGGNGHTSGVRNVAVEIQKAEDKQLVDLFADGKGLEDDM